jgi:hypothetical protein
MRQHVTNLYARACLSVLCVRHCDGLIDLLLAVTSSQKMVEDSYKDAIVAMELGEGKQVVSFGIT